MEGANALNRNGKKKWQHIVLLGDTTSICVPKANITLHLQMATSENEVNAPGAGADSSSPCRLLMWLRCDRLILQFFDRPVAWGV